MKILLFQVCVLSLCIIGYHLVKFGFCSQCPHTQDAVVCCSNKLFTIILVKCSQPTLRACKMLILYDHYCATMIGQSNTIKEHVSINTAGWHWIVHMYMYVHVCVFVCVSVSVCVWFRLAPITSFLTMLHLNTHECDHWPFIGVSFDDDEPTSSGAPPAKKMKNSSQSTDTDHYHDANNSKLIVTWWDTL